MFIQIFILIFRASAILEYLSLLGLKTDKKLEAEQNCIMRNYIIFANVLNYPIFEMVRKHDTYQRKKKL